MSDDYYGAVSPTPNTPEAIIHLPVNNMKPATPDLIQFNMKAVPIETMTNLVMEDIGGQELINISRSDLINGQNVNYSPIKNMSAINAEYNPLNIFNMQGIPQTIFNNFSIILEDHVPAFGTGTGPALPLTLNPSAAIKDSVYFDDNGNIVVNVTGLSNEDQVEIEIMTNTTTFLNTVW